VAAIDIHIGTQAPADRTTPVACDIDGKTSEVELGRGGRACVPELSYTHNGLTRMLWIRRELEDILAGTRVAVVDGGSLGRTGSAGARLYFTLDPSFEKYAIPWMPAANGLDSTAVIGKAGKMACPTWDLPAGSPLTGGSCPGATEGQSTIPVEIRDKAARAAGVQVRIRETICQLCYASNGQYASPHVQVGEIIRYWWCREQMATPEKIAAWVDTMVRAIQGEQFPDERMIDPRTGRPVLPMRVHSSGDFFSPTYARAWVEVCNRVPEVMFWAPTRTWASASWNEHWRRILPALQHGNLVLRPSAYHTGDAAPSAQDHPWAGDYPYTATGTTALYRFDDAGSTNGVSNDPRYDWSCQTYAIVDEAHSCPKARAPDGKIGCRVCWLRPDLRVNYTAH
jgi:hypothetical protein